MGRRIISLIDCVISCTPASNSARSPFSNLACRSVNGSPRVTAGAMPCDKLSSVTPFNDPFNELTFASVGVHDKTVETLSLSKAGLPTGIRVAADACSGRTSLPLLFRENSLFRPGCRLCPLFGLACARKSETALHIARYRPLRSVGTAQNAIRCGSAFPPCIAPSSPLLTPAPSPSGMCPGSAIPWSSPSCSLGNAPASADGAIARRTQLCSFPRVRVRCGSLCASRSSAPTAAPSTANWPGAPAATRAATNGCCRRWCAAGANARCTQVQTSTPALPAA